MKKRKRMPSRIEMWPTCVVFGACLFGRVFACGYIWHSLGIGLHAAGFGVGGLGLGWGGVGGGGG